MSDHEKKEIKNGVTIIHTGKYGYVLNGYTENIYGEKVSLGKSPYEIIEVYDEYGNKFYKNCKNREEANKLIEKLSKSGIYAITGPEAPINKNKNSVPNPYEFPIGVYIVEEKNKTLKK